MRTTERQAAERAEERRDDAAQLDVAGDSSEPSPELLLVRDEPFNAETPRRGLGSFLTPSALRFVRTNFGVPSLDPRAHWIEIGGSVARRLRLTLDELRSFPSHTVTATTECAGNHRTSFAPLPSGEPWRGTAVSTAQWSGVPLAEVLEKAGLHASAVEILVGGADRGTAGDREVTYERALPLEKALDVDTLLAFEMNGRPILPRHGAPLRLVVPDWYGMASVKWVARIEALTAPFAGYFQKERYVYLEPGGAPAPVERMRVKAVFLEGPAISAPLGPMTIEGLAWSGEGAIVKVEISCASGSWQPARLVGPSLPHCWRRWEFDWTPPRCGRFVLRCRASDARGNVQPESPRWNSLGYGANGVESLCVEVT